MRELLESEDIVEFDKIVDLAVHGIPTKTRGEVWKYLLLVSKPDKCEFFIFTLISPAEEVQHERNLAQEYTSIDKSAPNEMKTSIKVHFNRLCNQTRTKLQEDTQKLPFLLRRMSKESWNVLLLRTLT